MKLLYPVPETAVRTGTFGDGHYGIDWGIPEGTPITAAADGVVIRAGSDHTGYGDCVWIAGGGFLYIYAHLSVIYAVAGREVKAGDKIGLSGNTGNSTGPHLHFEMRTLNGSWPDNTIDPAPYLDNCDEIPSEEETVIMAGRAKVTVPVLNVRLSPTIAAPDVGDLTTGMIVELAGDAVHADGRDWQPVRLWVAREYLS